MKVLITNHVLDRAKERMKLSEAKVKVLARTAIYAYTQVYKDFQKARIPCNDEFEWIVNKIEEETFMVVTLSPIPKSRRMPL